MRALDLENETASPLVREAQKKVPRSPDKTGLPRLERLTRKYSPAGLRVFYYHGRQECYFHANFLLDTKLIFGPHKGMRSWIFCTNDLQQTTYQMSGGEIPRWIVRPHKATLVAALDAAIHYYMATYTYRPDLAPTDPLFSQNTWPLYPQFSGIRGDVFILNNGFYTDAGSKPVFPDGKDLN